MSVPILSWRVWGSVLLAPGHRGDPDRVSCTVTVTPPWGWDKGVPGPEVMKGKSLFLDNNGNGGGKGGARLGLAVAIGEHSRVPSSSRGVSQVPAYNQAGVVGHRGLLQQLEMAQWSAWVAWGGPSHDKG